MRMARVEALGRKIPGLRFLLGRTFFRLGLFWVDLVFFVFFLFLEWAVWLLRKCGKGKELGAWSASMVWFAIK